MFILFLNSASSGTVRWGLEFSWSNVGDDFDASTIVENDFSIAMNTGNTHYMQDLATLSGIGKKIGSILICRVFRDVTVASNYPSPVSLIGFAFELSTSGTGNYTAFAK